ncbi:MAG: UDP-N-acetylmuramoyl-L-alanyl-D-glutamate--2,6-diaminopimelate ligase, partial [Candidatus Andersenbacteria bacterium]|nr:UDP-N-acetylmuramoyl-L-alanyl-D-glutamate--2,6-diaminopimelate ligase [Candidatus Andersenbacteria bacterium]
SEGIAQFRHLGIAFDVVALVNLMPEHIESHGSYEAYRAAKARLFEVTAALPAKKLHGSSVVVPRVRVVPEVLEHPEDLEVFLTPSFPETITVGMEGGATVRAENVQTTPTRSSFRLVVEDESCDVRLETPGMFYVSNALVAAGISVGLGVSPQVIAQALNAFRGLSGRMERVVLDPFLVIVDYAHEPVSYRGALTAARMMSGSAGRVLAVIGATGGGRDVARRPEFGKIAAELVDVVVVTNEDPYDEDPQAIIDQIFSGVEQSGTMKEGVDAFRIPERRDAIQKVLELATPGDVVILLGKGSETVMAVADGRHIPWSDKETVLELLGSS